MFVAVLVLLWGSAFKVSLYHVFHNLRHEPVSKLLTDCDHSQHSVVAFAPRPDYPSAPAPAHFPAAWRLAPLRRAFVTLSPNLPPTVWMLSSQDAAHGIYFHRPPPTL